MRDVGTKPHFVYRESPPLLVFVLALMTSGCPVFGESRAPEQECGERGEVSNEKALSGCHCEHFRAMKVGEPIPGMEEGVIPRRGGTLRIVVDENISGLNPLLHHEAWTRRIVLRDVCESLVRQDSRTYEFRPALATHWEHNDLETEWTFHLRPDVRWHDGAPFTARDVAFTFDAVMNSANRTEVIRTIFQDMLDPEKGYEVIDDHTFVIRLKRPVALFLANIDLFAILPEHIFSHGDFNTHLNNRHPIGTGPFLFKTWTAQSIVLERNPDYWGRPPYLDRLEYLFVLDRDTAFAMIKRGDVDFSDRIMPHQREEGLTPELRERYEVIDLLPAQYAFWVYNTRTPLFSDPRTRRAMTMLINREQILCEVLLCQGEQITGPIQLHHPAYDAGLEPIPFDPEGAARLLSEAGWEDRDGDGIREKLFDGETVPFSFTFLLTNNSSSQEQMATLVQNTVRQAGIEMKLSKLDFTVLASRLMSHEFDVSGMVWSLNHDPDLYSVFHSTGEQNLGRWENSEMDILVDQGRYIMDETIRNLIFRRAHEIAYEEQPYTFMFVQTRTALILKGVRGVYTSDHWYQEYDMWLEGPAYPEVAPEERHPGAPGALPYDENGK